uniref:Multiplexin transcript 1 n=1 Tax=Anopheles coluzzii TaxID=1518534 RepID=A0A8W7PKQ6_ANOCL
LMGAIEIPLQNGVKFVDGLDGFPAFGVTSEADLKSPYKMILSDHLQDFALIATVRPQSSSGGWVFSVVNSLDTVVQLGLLLEPTAGGDQWNATLYYTDAKKERISQPLASFQVPYGKSWMKMIFKVLPDQVVFYYNCLEAGVVPVKKEPRKLVFDSASTVYIGQAGPVLKQKFEVSRVRGGLGRFFFAVDKNRCSLGELFHALLCYDTIDIEALLCWLIGMVLRHRKTTGALLDIILPLNFYTFTLDHL